MRETTYLSVHCHHQNDSCIKMGSDESHFNDSLICCEGQSHKTVSTDHSLKRNESRGGFEPKSLLTSLPPYRWAKPAHSVCSCDANGV